MKTDNIVNQNVKAVFATYPDDVKEKLLQLRKLILDVAENTDEAGNIFETLKWGVPSYLTEKPKSGLTIRLDPLEKQPDKYGIYVHCQSEFIEECRMTFGDFFRYEGTRGIVLNVNDDVPQEELRKVFYLALTYHLRKNKKKLL